MLCKLSGVGTVQKTLQCFHSARQIRLHNRKKSIIWTPGHLLCFSILYLTVRSYIMPFREFQLASCECMLPKISNAMRLLKTSFRVDISRETPYLHRQDDYPSFT